MLSGATQSSETNEGSTSFKILVSLIMYLFISSDFLVGKKNYAGWQSVKKSLIEEALG